MQPTVTPTTLLIAALFGLISSFVAFKRGKNPYLWFFLGFLLGALGIFAVILLSDFAKKRKPRKKRLSSLILDGPQDKLWFYLDATHQQIGPISYQSIGENLKQGIINPQTFVWHENLSSWKKIEELLKIHYYYENEKTKVVKT